MKTILLSTILASVACAADAPTISVAYIDAAACQRASALFASLPGGFKCVQEVQVIAATTDQSVRAFSVEVTYTDQDGYERSRYQVVPAFQSVGITTGLAIVSNVDNAHNVHTTVSPLSEVGPSASADAH